LSITAPEPAFEISRPYMIGTFGLGQRRDPDPTSFPRTALSRNAQSQALQPPGYRGCGGSLSILAQQTGLDLFSAPMLVALTRASNPLDPFPSHLQWHLMWPTGSITQITSPAFCEPVSPLVSCFATDAEDPTPLTDRSFAAE